MHRVLAPLAANPPGSVVCGLDRRDALTAIRRDAVIAECNRADARLGVVAEAWLNQDTEHVILADGVSEVVHQRVGLDQGCPLSPGFFAVATAGALRRVREAMQAVDPLAAVVAFLDDTYLLGQPDAVAVGFTSFGREMAAIGLTVNTTKTKVWRPPSEAAAADAPPRTEAGRLGGVGVANFNDGWVRALPG